MLRFYLPTFRRSFTILWVATDRYVATIGIGASVLTFFHPELARLPWGDLPAFSRWWAVVPLLALFAYGFLKALHERFAGLEERLAAVENRKAVKDLLGECADRGKSLEAKDLQRTVETDNGGTRALPHPEADEWTRRAHDLIQAAFDKGEAQHFLHGTGHRPAAYSGPVRLVAYDPYWSDVEPRLARLYELIVRANSLDVNPDFDPEEWRGR